MNNNTFNYIFDYIPPSGGDIEKKVLGGEKINNNLKDYRRFLGVQHQRQNTIDRYYNAALHFIRHSNGIVTRESVEEYIYHLNQTKKRNTIASEITGLNLYLKYCKQPELHQTIPKWEDTYRDVISKQEIQKLLKYARSNCHLMDYLILLFITDLDCRPHEIAKSQWSWIRGNKIYLTDCKTGNTYSYLTEELKTNLEIWKQQQPESNYIFTNYQSSYKGLPITAQTQKIRDLIHKVSRKVIGRKLNPQDLRASVITAEFNEYINPKIIQRKARHRSFKSTMKYNHVDDKQLMEYLDTGTIFNNNIEPIFKGKPKNAPDNGGCIKDFVPLDTLNDEEENYSFSFSVSFFQTSFSSDKRDGDTSWGWGAHHLFFELLDLSLFFKTPQSHLPIRRK